MGARASLPVSALDVPATVRLALGACARTLARKAEAGSPQRRKRSVFYNALATRSSRAPLTPVRWVKSDQLRQGAYHGLV
jgi:hypothetical protein